MVTSPYNSKANGKVEEIRINNVPDFMQITTVWVLFIYAICYLNMIMSPLTSALNTKDCILTS